MSTALAFLAAATLWLNSPPLSPSALHGKVVLVNFWTYSCINSLRALPYVQSWSQKYKRNGLVVIGVHTPEFSFEKNQTNVDSARHDLGVGYPVAMDNDYRDTAFGEGDYAQIERHLQVLLRESGARGVSDNLIKPVSREVEAPASLPDELSPETYIGSAHAERRTDDRLAHLNLNHWGLSGSWDVDSESGLLTTAPGKIVFRFHSRDLHLVMGPSENGRPIRYRLKLDGVAPAADCGADCAADGSGVVREPRLYQLIRQKNTIKDRTLEIDFLDAGVRAYVFTFG
jgi:thiol-disulfide isomerase/thioredoxin